MIITRIHDQVEPVSQLIEQVLKRAPRDYYFYVDVADCVTGFAPWVVEPASEVPKDAGLT